MSPGGIGGLNRSVEPEVSSKAKAQSFHIADTWVDREEVQSRVSVEVKGASPVLIGCRH